MSETAATRGRVPLVRGTLLGLAAALSLFATQLSAQPRSDYVHQRKVDVPFQARELPALVSIPRRPDRSMAPETGAYPVVITVPDHGPRSYVRWNAQLGLPAAFGALSRGSLRTQDLSSAVSDVHLTALNARLGRRPFAPVVWVSPALPAGLNRPEVRAQYLEWLRTTLLETVRETFEGVTRDAAATGIDGVGPGGWLALEAGLGHGETFGSVGAIALAPFSEGDTVATLAEAASREAPVPLRLFAPRDGAGSETTTSLSQALRERFVPHRVVHVAAEADDRLIRGAGAVELLQFHADSLGPAAAQGGAAE